MSRHTAWDIEAARRMLGQMAGMPGPVLPMLHALQDRFGHIHPDAVALVAEVVNVSRAEVHGTISFYHDFRTTPPPARVIHLCRAEACQSVGCETLVEAVRSRLGLAVDAPDAGAEVAILSAYCLGNCALGPAALVDGELVAHLDADGLEALCAGHPAAELQAPLP